MWSLSPGDLASAYTSANTAQGDQLASLLAESDWIKVGLAGNLRDYSLVNAQGQTVTKCTK